MAARLKNRGSSINRARPMAARLISGGAGSEAWDRVSMIALVKKFGRARLSTGFRGKETWWTSVRKVFVKICEHVAYFTFKHLK